MKIRNIYMKLFSSQCTFNNYEGNNFFRLCSYTMVFTHCLHFYLRDFGDFFDGSCSTAERNFIWCLSALSPSFGGTIDNGPVCSSLLGRVNSMHPVRSAFNASMERPDETGV
jgi:hypothetical protein